MNSNNSSCSTPANRRWQLFTYGIVGIASIAIVHLFMTDFVDNRISRHCQARVFADEIVRVASAGGSLSGGGGGMEGPGYGYGQQSQRPKLFNTQGEDPKPAVPMSLVIPCQTEDFFLLPMMLESLANQTIFPQETLLVLNIPPGSADGSSFLNFDFTPSVVRERYAKSMAEALDTPRRSEVKEEGVQYVTKSRAPTEWSFQEVPNLRILVRAGKHYAGSNRMYGARAASNSSKLISFFDCDDYLHPQRTEYVWKTFVDKPELDALIHGFTLLTMTGWELGYEPFMEHVDYMPQNMTFLWDYKTIHSALPVAEFANETNGEPRQTKDSLWFFPRKMSLPRVAPYPSMGHNGWLTVRRQVLDEVPYPEDLSRGQDSLYNWRLIVAKKNWNHLPLRLAAYVRVR